MHSLTNNPTNKSVHFMFKLGEDDKDNKIVPVLFVNTDAF